MFGRKFREKAARARERFFSNISKFSHLKKSQQKLRQGIEPRYATTPPGSPAVVTGLRVSVTARFESPLDKNFDHTYEASPDFEVTDEYCNGLLRRIDHCANELITRPDPRAAEALRYSEPRTKKAKYHLIFRIERQGSPWKERYFTSFQEQPMTMDAAHEIVLEADRIIFQFLDFHDPGYMWELPSVVEEDPLQHKTANPEVGAPQSPYCVPSYSGRPGYSIHLILRTQDNGHSRTWSAKVDSQQASPLTLHLGENLMSQITTTLRQAVKEKETRFAEIHNHCDSLEGTFGCRHFEESAFDLVVKVQNNLGPDYPHFATRIQTFRRLLTQGHGTAFVQELERLLEAARELSDDLINNEDDLVLKVHELRSKDWKIHQPLTLTIGASVLISRKTSERILERVQAGMTDVLRGHGTVAVLTAHKRGHLVLETAVCWGEDTEFYDLKLFDSLNLKKRALQQRLRDRIQDDIELIMKDTISLANPLDLPKLNIYAAEELTVEPLNARAEALVEDTTFPSRRLTKKSPLFDLRRRSLEEAEAVKSEVQTNLAEDYGYMADIVSEKSDSLHTPTPSLADTASINLLDGAKTPESIKPTSLDFSAAALGIMSSDDSRRDAMKRFQGNINESSTGTMIHHPQPVSGSATNLLASYWEPTSSDSSGLNEPGIDVVRDLRKDPNIWNTQFGNEKFGDKEQDSYELKKEESWFANKSPMTQKLATARPVESPRQSLIKEFQTAKISKGSEQKFSLVGAKQALEVAINHASESRTAVSNGSELAKYKSTGTQAGAHIRSQALILREFSNPFEFFPRRRSAQSAPARTLVHAQGLFHRRQFSAPAGGHLGLHGDWVIEMGLRNALVPSHLRDAPSDKSDGWPGHPLGN